MPLYNQLFLSSSDVGSFILTADGKRYYDIPKKEVVGVPGTEFVPDNFVFLNYHICDPITGSSNTLGFPLDIDWSNFDNTAYNRSFCDGGFSSNNMFVTYFNTLMNKRNGSYQFPSWKQIRNSDHPLVRWQRENNYVPFLEPPEQKVVVKDNSRFVIMAKRSGVVSFFNEPPVVVKYNPLVIGFGVGKYLDSPVNLKVSYGNIVSKFSDNNLNKKSGVSIATDTVFDRIVELSSEKEENRVVDNVDFIVYPEGIYPKEENVFREEIRSRKLYNFQWSDSRNARSIQNSVNSQGYSITNQSVWPLDARINYALTAPSTGSVSHGELQNSYTQYFGGEKYIVDPNLPGNYVKNVFNFNPSGKPGVGFEKSIEILNHFTVAYTVACFDDFRSAAVVPYSWNTILNANGEFTISAWIYLPFAYQDIVTELPPRMTIVSLGNTYSFYVTTSSVAAVPYPTLDSYAYKNNLANRGLAFSASYVGGTGVGAQWVSDSNVFKMKQWYHVAVTFNNSLADTVNKTKIYVDGSLISCYWTAVGGVGNGVETISPDQLVIGSSSYVPFFHGIDYSLYFSKGTPDGYCPAPFFGYISNVSIFTGSLSAVQISTLYNDGYPKSLYLLSSTVAQKLISWWPLGDGVGLILGKGRDLGTNPLTLTASFGGAVVAYDRITSSQEFSPYDAKRSIAFDMAGLNHGVIHQANTTQGYMGGSYVISPFKCESPEIPLYGEAEKNRFSLDLGCDNFKVGTLYSRGELVYTGPNTWITKSFSSATGTRDVRMTASRSYIGETPWFVYENDNRIPFYNSYRDFSNDIYYGFKEYSIIPEFRVSERIDYYIENGMNYLKEDESFLSLTGSEILDNSNANFFKVFSNTEFLKSFEVIKNSYQDSLEEGSLSLKCAGVLKLLPYNGFFPAQRTLQLAELFSRSYGNNVRPLWSTNDTERTASWRSFLTPFFAPGIIYNSIKAGMAVDYPIYTVPPTVREDFIQWTGSYDFVSGGAGFKYQAASASIEALDPVYYIESSGSLVYRGIHGFPFSASFSAYYSDYLGSLFPVDLTASNWFGTFPSTFDEKIEWHTVLNKDFSKRLPFVSILEPENYIAKQTIYDIEPDYSASLRMRYTDPNLMQGSIWDGNSKPNFKLAMHNFLSEVPNFFLQDGKMTAFVSNPISKEGININSNDANSYFGMDVVVSNGAVLSLTDWNRRRNMDIWGDIYNVTHSYQRADIENIVGINTKMYSRDSAFGPPWVYNDDLFVSGERMESYHFGYEPFTPAYFNGFGLARILFYPYKGAGTYTLDEIQSHSEIYYIRMPSYRVGVMALNKIDRLLEWSTIASMDKNLFVSKSIDFGGRLDGGVEKYRSPYDVANVMANATNNWQQINSSVELLGKTKVKSVTFEKGFVNDYEPVSFSDTETDSKQVWTIYPKWETPILNFKNTYVSSSGFYETASQGMWHQYGNFCTGSEGIFLSIQDISSQKLCSVEYDLSGTINGAPFKEREENLYELENENAYVDLFIRDYTKLSGFKLFVDFSILEEDVVSSGREWQGFFDATTSNLATAQSIAKCINTNWYVTFKYGKWKDEGYTIDTGVAAGSMTRYRTDIGVPVKNRLKATVFIPEKHPWEYLGGTNQVVAVRIQAKECVSSASFTYAHTEKDKSLSPYYKGINYPNYYRVGDKSNSLLAVLGDSTATVKLDTTMDGWALRGAKAVYTTAGDGGLDCSNKDWLMKDIPRINEVVYDACVYFHGGKDNKYQVKSLANLIGFPKIKKRMGEVENGKIIKEAIVAIPFVEYNNRRNFFSISRREIELVSGNKKLKENEKMPGKSIVDMVLRMKDYVIPPTFDFLNNVSINPFVMYIFEFSHVLTNEDLRAIWQNTMPDISIGLKTSEVTIKHDFLSNEFFRGSLQDKIRWMVFKVKQKGKMNYYETTLDQSDDARFKFAFEVGGKKSEVIPQYSYNWPYDYFSLIELAKIGAEIEFKKK